MGLRRHVIGTYVARIPALVLGESGWLVAAGEVNSFADAIVEGVRESQVSLDGMGETAQQRVLDRHDVDVEAAKLAHQVREQLPQAAP